MKQGRETFLPPPLVKCKPALTFVGTDAIQARAPPWGRLPMTVAYFFYFFEDWVDHRLRKHDDDTAIFFLLKVTHRLEGEHFTYSFECVIFHFVAWLTCCEKVHYGILCDLKMATIEWRGYFAVRCGITLLSPCCLSHTQIFLSFGIRFVFVGDLSIVPSWSPLMLSIHFSLSERL